MKEDLVTFSLNLIADCLKLTSKRDLSAASIVESSVFKLTENELRTVHHALCAL